MANRNNTQIFFSYGHDEYSPIVLKLKKYLEDEGYQVFFDTEQLHVKDDWAYKLEEGIRKSDKVIFFITPYSARRPDGYCLNELAMALYYKKEILPVMIKFEIPPLSIARMQYLDIQELVSNDDLSPLKEKAQYLMDIIENRIQLDFEGVQVRVLKELNPINFTQDFAKHKKIIGRRWIIDKIDRWVEDNDSSSLFWIVAEAGYGKSAITTYLSHTHPKVIGVHLCAFNYPEKQNPSRMIMGIASYLLSQIPNYQKEIENIDELSSKSAHELFEILILNPLQKIQLGNSKYIIIIDALDEALIDANNLIANLIRDEFQRLPSNIKVIVTSRPDPKLKQILSSVNPLILEAKEEENLLDCQEYISYFLNENNYKEFVDDKEWRETLLQKSQSNMLYLTRFFTEVQNKNIDIRNPKSFPQSLNGLYAEFFSRIVTDEEDYYDNYAPIFEVLVAFEKAVSKRLLRDILGLNKIALKQKLKKFGTLLREENDSIGFYHKSLSDWLLMEENYAYEIDIEEGYKKVYEYTKDLNLDTIPIELLEIFSKAVVYLDKQDVRYQKYYLELRFKIMHSNDAFQEALNNLELDLTNINYNEVVIKLMKDFQNFGLFYFYTIWHNYTEKEVATRLKSYYYLFSSETEISSNYGLLLSDINMDTQQSISVLSNYAYDFPKEEWDWVKREALRKIFNPLAQALIIEDERVYKYIKKNSIIMQENSLMQYIEDILFGTSTQYYAYEIHEALKEKIN